MLDSTVFAEDGASIGEGFTSIFFSTISIKELKFIARLSFNHCYPAFEDCEERV